MASQPAYSPPPPPPAIIASEAVNDFSQHPLPPQQSFTSETSYTNVTANHTKQNSAGHGYAGHKTHSSYSSNNLDNYSQPQERYAAEGEAPDEYGLPLQPPPVVLPRGSRPSSAGPNRSSGMNSRPQSSTGSYGTQSPYQSPRLHPATTGGGIPRSASTPAVNSPNSPYTHQQRNSSSNGLLGYPQTNYRHSRLSSHALSTRSSVSSLDFSAPGVTGREGRSHSPAMSDLAGLSAFDLNQSFITTNLGENSASLLPRIKTIELYRKNAKKSNDPVIQFQFAQYMLQTALLSGTKGERASFIQQDEDISHANGSPARGHSSTLSVSSITGPALASTGPLTAAQESKIKHDLLKESISHLHKLSDRGFPDAQYLLGDAYASGALGKPDLKESFLLFQLAAKHGHAEASYRAALCLEEGWGVSKDARRAVQFLRQSASRGHPGAMLRLGIACFYGKLGLHVGSSAARGKTQQEGIKWLTRASDSANETFPQGPFELAKIYEEGYRDIVFKDIQYTVQLYVKSADLNYGPAAAKLGHAYEYGTLGCPQDAALSIHYYTIAALSGDPTAMLAMCAWYMVGAEPMLPRNEEEAFEWASRAAQRGLAKAQYATGYFLENGIGCDRDILQSTSWYRKAAHGGDERAIERLKNNRQLATQTQTKHRKTQENGAGSNAGGKPKDKDCIIM